MDTHSWRIGFEAWTSCRLTSRWSQPPLALVVPLSRSTSRVGGGSAFYVERRHIPYIYVWPRRKTARAMHRQPSSLLPCFRHVDSWCDSFWVVFESPTARVVSLDYSSLWLCLAGWLVAPSLAGVPEEKMQSLTPNLSLELTAAALSAFYGCGRFAAPGLRRGAVPGGCGSVRR